jgi:hypothetical protein
MLQNALFSTLLSSFSGHKRPIGIPKCGWEDTIKIYLNEIECEGWARFKWFRIETNGGLL